MQGQGRRGGAVPAELECIAARQGGSICGRVQLVISAFTAAFRAGRFRARGEVSIYAVETLS